MHHNSLLSCIPFSPLSSTIEHCRAEREREAESRASALEQFLTERSLLFGQSGVAGDSVALATPTRPSLPPLPSSALLPSNGGPEQS